MSFNPFTDHKIIEFSEVRPFKTGLFYLYISMDYQRFEEAYLLHKNAPMDLEYLLSKAISDFDVEVDEVLVTGGPHYAAIKHVEEEPNSFLCWSSCDFYLKGEE